MKKLLLILSVILHASFLFAQLNLTYKSQVLYQESLSDVWGYAAPDGREYALVGLNTGVSIIDVTDTENPVDVGKANGPSSSWRDIKEYAGYAYVTNESSDGLLVIDLTNLPNPITADDYFYWAPSFGGQGELSSCHNIFIDEFGVAYLVGCGNNSGNRINDGGAIFIDVATTPGSPEYIAMGPSVYAHDIFVRDNVMYNSEIYQGTFTIYNVSDKQDVQLLASQQTPFTFTHNAWLSDDSNTIFTTDEKANAPVAAYDISDLDDIEKLDEYNPIATLGDGVIPHNVHVWNDWLIISYYTDGCIIVDGSRPENLIEVGNFDTYIPASTGFNGVWGAYPFLPSQTVLATDIGNGLYVLEPNYVRACWLEGKVTDLNSGAALQEVQVDIASSQPNLAFTDLSGNYQTGQAIAGTFDVTFTLQGYFPKTVSVDLENGELIILDVQLESMFAQFNVNGQVISALSGLPIPNAQVLMAGDFTDYNVQADGNGNFSVDNVFEGDYEVLAGAWGAITSVQSIIINSTNTVTIPLDEGYKDDFILDLGWEELSSANSGIWERGEPVGTFGGGGGTINPEFDLNDDLGDQAYVTGNGGGNPWDDDVDDGFTRLTSQVMDLSDYNNPVMNYHRWFWNGGGSGTPNDFLQVSISNGTEEVVVDIVNQNTNDWEPVSIVIADFIDLTDNMRVIFETADLPSSGNILEAAIDGFEVLDSETYLPFFADVVEGCMPLEVNFTDPNNTATSWEWTFEGGFPQLSNEENPTVSYFSGGTYSVTLVATTPNGVFTHTEEQLINVKPLPTASFTYEFINDSTVVFTSDATDVTTYQWDFGDGNFSNEANPTYIYDESGIFTVALIAGNDCGASQSSEVIEVSLFVNTINLIGNYKFEANPNPFIDRVNIVFDFEKNPQNAIIRVYSVLGQLINAHQVTQQNGMLSIGDDLQQGVYFVELRAEGQPIETIKIIKQ